MPRKYVTASHPTGLQKRLIDEVVSMMRANDKKLADLSRETGLGKSYLSLLLHGHRPGTMATWDLMISTGKKWGIIVPQRLLVDGYNAPLKSIRDLEKPDKPKVDDEEGPVTGEPDVEEIAAAALRDASIDARVGQPVAAGQRSERVNRFRPE